MKEAIPVPDQGWQIQPEAARFVTELLDRACDSSPWLAQLRRAMLEQTGTRLFDWVDHLAIPPHFLDPTETQSCNAMRALLSECGFQEQVLPVPTAGKLTADESEGEHYWIQPEGIFPRIVSNLDVTRLRVVLKVESVSDFLVAQRLQDSLVEGSPGGRMQKSLVLDEDDLEIHVVARNGWPLWRLPSDSPDTLLAAAYHRQRLQCRSRSYDQVTAFSDSLTRLRAAVEDLGPDWACCLHFDVERSYWQSRNRAARVQKHRQDRLGLGWANHDHHTYRCSRAYFRHVIECLETVGMRCRERFYAGEQAGWGAQVLEQPVVGIVVFADVDLQPEELSGDFAHEGLAAQQQLGTVGLWCQLHGDSLFAAGLHHLECQFDFQSAREQLESDGIGNMKPFTDFQHLKQSFTEPEMWPVNDARLKAAVGVGALTEKQAEEIRGRGAIGSHLEVLERNDGFKGFNQTGISDIISKTDPRKVLGTH